MEGHLKEGQILRLLRPVTGDRSPRSRILLGPGWLEEFCVNGELKLEKISWAKRCDIIPGRGLLCDGRRRCRIRAGDKWSVSRMKSLAVINLFEKQ